MGGNEALVAFLQRAIGYALTGHTNEQVLFLLYGVGANGKSTFLETIRALLGDLSAIADFNTFLKRDSDGARNDIARLVGTRFVSAVEAEAGKPLAEALVKQLRRRHDHRLLPVPRVLRLPAHVQAVARGEPQADDQRR